MSQNDLVVWTPKMERITVAEGIENIWYNVSRLKWSNKLKDPDLCDILNLTKPEFDYLQSTQQDLSMNSLISLSRHFGVSLDELIHTKISVRKALQNQRSNISLPEKFAVAAKSKVRTSYHIINFLEQKKNFDSIEQFLNRAEVPYEIFGDLTHEINVDFITELCGWLTRNHFVTKNDLYLMGLNTYEVNKNTEMAEKLAKFESLKDLHLFQINQFMNFFDRNAHYRIKSISDTQCIASWTHNPEVCEGLKKKRIASLQVETYQLGVAASFPLFLRLPPSRVRMISSLHVGDAETAFEIDFSHAVEILKKRKRLKLIPSYKQMEQQ